MRTRRAFARGDMPAAANLLRRAVALLPMFDQERLDLLPDLGEALMDVGEFPEADRVLREAIAAGDEAGDHRLRADAALGLTLVEFYADPPPEWSQRANRIAHAAIPVFELFNDAAGLAKAWRVLGAVHATALRYGQAAAAVARASAYARAAGDLRQERRNAASFAVAAVYGPTPVPLAIVECSRIVAEATGDHRTVEFGFRRVQDPFPCIGFQLDGAGGHRTDRADDSAPVGRGARHRRPEPVRRRREMAQGTLRAIRRRLRLRT